MDCCSAISFICSACDLSEDHRIIKCKSVHKPCWQQAQASILRNASSWPLHLATSACTTCWPIYHLFQPTENLVFLYASYLLRISFCFDCTDKHFGMSHLALLHFLLIMLYKCETLYLVPVDLSFCLLLLLLYFALNLLWFSPSALYSLPATALLLHIMNIHGNSSHHLQLSLFFYSVGFFKQIWPWDCSICRKGWELEQLL